MRRRRRRRRPPSRQRRSYSLGYLLSQQPKTLRKDPRYARVVERLEASAGLLRLRVPRRCYSLLHGARISPEDLSSFYRTYGIPKDPFFPLFLEIKRDYLADRERYREERRQYILATVRSVPQPTLDFIKYLGYLEEHYNPRRLHPLWQAELFPRSKKQAKAYLGYGHGEWVNVFRRHLRLLSARYRGLSEPFAEKLLACYLLDCLPPEIPPQWPDDAAVSRAYRRMSLLHHPDRGGDHRVFIQVRRARETLIGE